MSRFSTWLDRIFPVAVSLLFLLPVAFLLSAATRGGDTPLWSDAPELVGALTLTTLRVILIAGLVAGVLGGFCAWAVTACIFPGRRLVSVLLCLPFTLPPYLLAGIYQALQQRGTLPLPPLENEAAAGVLFGIALYPWVYLPLKMHLAEQAATWREMGATLGLGPRQRFLRIHAPLTAPMLGVGLLLVAMEVVSDFGTVTLLGVRTLSVGIHETMFSMFRKDWAAQLSLLGLAIPLIGLLGFALWYRRRSVRVPPNRSAAAEGLRPVGWRLGLLWTGLMIPLILGFMVPFISLGTWAVSRFGKVPLHELPAQLWDTIRVVGWVAALTLCVALLFNLIPRFRPRGRIWSVLTPAINLNYALPGVMLAIALLFLSADAPAAVSKWMLSDGVGLLVLGGVLGYCCFPYLSIQAGLQRLSPRLDDLSRCVGWSAWQRLRRVYLPLLRRPLACGALLVVVNMARELPLTEVLHPFGHQALSQRLYTYAGLGLLEESALHALCLVAVLVYPVITLDRLLTERNPAC